eukprot:g1464.t1
MVHILCKHYKRGIAFLLHSCQYKLQAQLGMGQEHPQGQVGLENLGQTCYLSVAVHCLAHTPCLPDWLMSHAARWPADSAEAELADVLSQLRAGHSRRASPRRLKQASDRGTNAFAGDGEQRDAFEYLLWLLDLVHVAASRKEAVPKQSCDCKDGNKRLHDATRPLSPCSFSLSISNPSATPLYKNVFAAAMVFARVEWQQQRLGGRTCLLPQLWLLPSGTAAAKGAAHPIIPLHPDGAPQLTTQLLDLARLSLDEFTRACGYDSPVTTHLHFQARQTMQCPSCGSCCVSFKVLRFVELPLSVPGQRGSIVPEWRCFGCLATLSAFARLNIWSRPRVLIVRLARTVLQKSTDHIYKIPVQVEIPRGLVLLLETPQEAAERLLQDLVAHQFQGVETRAHQADKQPSKPQTQRQPHATNKPQHAHAARREETEGQSSSVEAAPMDLYAIVNHIGNGSKGHFVAHCRHRQSGAWHTFDDQSVRALHLRYSCIRSRTAYILLYNSEVTVSPSHDAFPTASTDVRDSVKAEAT